MIAATMQFASLVALKMLQQLSNVDMRCGINQRLMEKNANINFCEKTIWMFMCCCQLQSTEDQDITYGGTQIYNDALQSIASCKLSIF